MKQAIEANQKLQYIAFSTVFRFCLTQQTA